MFTSDDLRGGGDDVGAFVTNGSVYFSIGGGCASVGGSKRSVNLRQDVSVTLAKAVAARIG